MVRKGHIHVPVDDTEGKVYCAKCQKYLEIDYVEIKGTNKVTIDRGLYWWFCIASWGSLAILMFFGVLVIPVIKRGVAVWLFLVWAVIFGIGVIMMVVLEGKNKQKKVWVVEK